MQRLNKIIIALLIVSLAFNTYVIFKISSLRELIAHDFENYLEVTIKDDLDGISDSIDQIKQGQQWISEIVLEAEESVGNKQIINMSWQIKDYVSGSDVMFYYRKSGEESFQQLPAIPQTAGRFETNLELNKESQPLWAISSWHDGQKNTISQIDKESLYRFEYYVVLDDGGRILSSDVQYLNIKKIIQTYSSIDVDITIDNERMPSVIEFYIDQNRIQPDQFALEIYNDGAANVEILEINNDSDIAAKWKAEDHDFDKIIVKAQYVDGKTFQKEIWNGNAIE